MRIGIDATCWANRRGYGRVTRELCREMVRQAPEDEFVFFVDQLAAECIDVQGPNVRLVVVEQGVSPTEAAASDGNRSPADMLRFTFAVRREPLDVFLSPSVYSYFPLPFGLRAVVTIMDAIAERFPELTLPSKRARLFWNAKVRLAIWQARLVLTISEYSARELGEVHKIPRERVRVAVSAPSADFRPSESPDRITAMAAQVGLPVGARWFVYVGGFNPHKHVDTIVRAHARLAAEHPDQPPHLLLVGAIAGDVFHGDQGRIRAAIVDAGTEQLVHWTGFLPDEELRHLHSGAVALVLPSALEGLGLPAVEAAACGTPVVATETSPLPELLEGGGFFVPPGDDDAVLTGMRRLYTDAGLHAEMAAIAKQRADQITWPKSAAATLEALREAAR